LLPNSYALGDGVQALALDFPARSGPSSHFRKRGIRSAQLGANGEPARLATARIAPGRLAAGPKELAALALRIPLVVALLAKASQAPVGYAANLRTRFLHSILNLRGFYAVQAAHLLQALFHRRTLHPGALVAAALVRRMVVDRIEAGQLVLAEGLLVRQARGLPHRAEGFLKWLWHLRARQRRAGIFGRRAQDTTPALHLLVLIQELLSRQFASQHFLGPYASVARNMMAHGVHRLAGRVRKVGRFAGKAPETLPADDAECRLHPQNVAGISI